MAKNPSGDAQDKAPASGKSSKRPSRLGRGLSSLMAKPVQTEPPAAAQTNPVAPANPPKTASPTDPPKPQPKPTAAGQSAAQADRPASPATPEPAPAPSQIATAPAAENASVPDENAGVIYLPLDRIAPNPSQPRRQFDEVPLAQLADSIKAAGLMQPIIVRPDPNAADPSGAGSTDTASYQIVAGERRWRAASKAGLSTIPVILRELDDREVAEWALIENLQREDLNPIERAEAFKNLTEQFGLSHEEIATQIGIDRSSVSNLLRLLILEDSVQELVRQGMLSMGQARALVSLTNTKLQKGLASQAVREDWSVRRTEQAVRNASEADLSAAPKGGASKTTISPRASHLRDLEKQIGEQLQTKVKIKAGKKKGTGTLSIDFYSLEQFDALTEKLGVSVE